MSRNTLITSLTLCAALCLGAIGTQLRGAGSPPSSDGPLAELRPDEGLVLRDGTASITLHCAQGRPSWGAANQRALSAGFVNTRAVAERQLETSTFKSEMSELQKEGETATADLRTRGAALAEEMKGLDRKSEEYRRAYDDYSRVRRELTSKEKDFSARAEKLACRHLEQGLKDIRAAVEIVAERRGIDIVHQISPQDDRLPKSDMTDLWRAIEAKVVLAYPEDLEITDDVIEELKLR